MRFPSTMAIWGNRACLSHLTRICAIKKSNHLMDAFQSQLHKRWFQPETFRSLMRLRGMECNSPSGYAEAFFCRKMRLGR